MVMRFKSFFILALILFLAACGKSESSGSNGGNGDLPDVTYSFENEAGQSFQIIHAYKLFNPFFEEVRNVPASEQTEVYVSSVIEPINEACFKDGEYASLAKSVTEDAPKNRIATQDVIKRLNYNDLNNSIKEALSTASEKLPTEGVTTVCIFPTTETLQNVILTAGAGKITVLFNRNFNNDIVKAGVAKEYPKSVWTEKNGAPSTVLDYLVFHGKGNVFGKTLYPDVTFVKVNPEFKEENWSQIEGDLDKADEERALQILRGGGDLPTNYGFSEGYKMVEAFLEANSSLSEEEWVMLSAEEIFEQGNYADNY